MMLSVCFTQNLYYTDSHQLFNGWESELIPETIGNTSNQISTATLLQYVKKALGNDLKMNTAVVAVLYQVPMIKFTKVYFPIAI